MNNIKNKKGDLLLEFFSEEIPARMQLASERQLECLFTSALSTRGINYEKCSTFSGPRHLSIMIGNIDLKQKDKKIEIRGPRVNSNKKALNGFLKSQNIDISHTFIKKTQNGDFYCFLDKQKGIKISEVLPQIVNDVVKNFVWPKSQRWAYTNIKWARPLRNILIILDNKTIKGSVDLGNNSFLKFTNYTFGHRHHNKKIVIRKIKDYEFLLKKNHVLIDREKRRKKILSDINHLLKSTKNKIFQDESLLNEVLGLSEFPNVLEGSISDKFMHLPREVLITSMRIHQKYFSVTDGKENLLPKFVFISNSIPNKKRDRVIVEGNERVLRARLSDASFFGTLIN